MRRNTMYKTIWASLIGFVWIAAFAGISRACTSTPVADIAADEDGNKYAWIDTCVRFDGSGSCDRDEDGQSIEDYDWQVTDGGDYEIISGQNTAYPVMVFHDAVQYTVRLSVQDDEGHWSIIPDDQATCTVHVQDPTDPTQTQVVYVKHPGYGDETGVDWDNACATIQSGFAKIENIGKVYVWEDTYTENIDFQGKNILLVSANATEEIVPATTIQGDGTGPVVRYAGDEDNSCQILGFTITNGGFVGPEDPDSRLQAYWKLDENSGNSAPDSAGIHNGTLAGDYNWYPNNGVVGGSLYFDGDGDYVDVGHDGSMNSVNFTISHWMKIYANNPSAHRTMVASADPWALDPSYYHITGYLLTVGPNDQFHFFTGVGGDPYWDILTANTYDVPVDTWIHVAASFSAFSGPDTDGRYFGIKKIYVNGVEITSTNGSYIPNQTLDLRMGNVNYDGDDHYFKGYLDDVQIYDRALSDGEIFQLAGPKAHWKLDEEDGATTAKDEMGHFIGTLTNMDGTEWCDGWQKGALEFNVSNEDHQYVSTSYAGILGTQARTTAAWIKTSYESGYQFIMDWGESIWDPPNNISTYGSGWYMYLDSQGQLYTDAWGCWIRANNSDLNDGQWHHVAAVLEEGGTDKTIADVKLYIDGALVTNTSIGGNVTSAVINTLLGYSVSLGVHRRTSTNGYSEDHYFSGLMDDVRIYDRALDGDDVERLYISYRGGGIQCNHAAPVISNCVITGNTAQYGAGIADCDGIIENCLITNNTGMEGGIGSGIAGSRQAEIINCTIADNDGYGLYGCGPEGLITNSIIWGNTSGQLKNCTLPATYSCIQDWGAGGGIGNIASDPEFVAPGNQDYHLQPVSLCINAGDPTSDCSLEPYGGAGRINIGAYGNTPEAAVQDSDGDTMNNAWEVFYGLNPLVDDTTADADNDGINNLTEFQIGTNPNDTDSDDDGMDDGWEYTYELYPLDDDADGNLDGDDYTNIVEYYHDSEPDDPGSIPTDNYTFNVTADAGSISLAEAIEWSIDGDTITVNPGTYDLSAPIVINEAGVTIQGSNPDDWAAVAATLIQGDGSGDVITVDTAAAGVTIEGITITGSGTGNAAIVCNSSGVTFGNCIIEGNDDGIVTNSASPDIENSIIRNNTGTAITLDSGTPKVTNTCITGNDVGITITGGTPMIRNNTIADNTTLGIDCDTGATPNIINCIVWGNGGNNWGGSIVTYSCVSANPTGHETNIIANPLFADTVYHLQKHSPCVNTGNSSLVEEDEKDIDGQVRIQSNGVDMGGDEVIKKTVFYVKPGGGSPQDGLSWNTAFDHPADALTVAKFNDEIWAAEGTYYGSITLQPGVGLYGGFVGTEETREERNWYDNTTILDGQDIIDHVVIGADYALLDGFTISGGNANGTELYAYGGGMLNIECSSIIRNCIFKDNSANGNGGGIYNLNCTEGVYIDKCTIEDNHADSGLGGGMYNENSVVFVTNSGIWENTAVSGNQVANDGTSVVRYYTCNVHNSLTDDSTTWDNSVGENVAGTNNQWGYQYFTQICVAINERTETCSGVDLAEYQKSVDYESILYYRGKINELIAHHLYKSGSGEDTNFLLNNFEMIMSECFGTSNWPNDQQDDLVYHLNNMRIVLDNLGWLSTQRSFDCNVFYISYCYLWWYFSPPYEWQPNCIYAETTALAESIFDNGGQSFAGTDRDLTYAWWEFCDHLLYMGLIEDIQESIETEYPYPIGLSTTYRLEDTIHGVDIPNIRNMPYYDALKDMQKIYAYNIPDVDIDDACLLIDVVNRDGYNNAPGTNVVGYFHIGTSQPARNPAAIRNYGTSLGAFNKSGYYDGSIGIDVDETTISRNAINYIRTTGNNTISGAPTQEWGPTRAIIQTISVPSLYIKPTYTEVNEFGEIEQTDLNPDDFGVGSLNGSLSPKVERDTVGGTCYKYEPWMQENTSLCRVGLFLGHPRPESQFIYELAKVAAEDTDGKVRVLCDGVMVMDENAAGPFDLLLEDFEKDWEIVGVELGIVDLTLSVFDDTTPVGSATVRVHVNPAIDYEAITGVSPSTGRVIPVPGIGVAAAVHMHNRRLKVTHSDFVVPGRKLSFGVSQIYRSGHPGSELLGAGWSANWDQRFVKQSDTSYLFIGPDGREDEFPVCSTDPTKLVIPPGYTCRANIDDNETTEVITIVIEYTDGSTATYQSIFQGDIVRLREFQDRYGNTIVYTYDGSDVLDKVTDDMGREYDFTFGGNPTRLVSVADFAGKTYIYQYGGPDTKLTGVELYQGTTQISGIEYVYDPQGDHHLHRIRNTGDLGDFLKVWYDPVETAKVQMLEWGAPANNSDEPAYVAEAFIPHDFLINQMRHVDTNGVVAEYIFDPSYGRNMLATQVIVDPEGLALTTNYNYTDDGGHNEHRVTKTTHPLGNTTEYTYKTDYSSGDEVIDKRGFANVLTVTASPGTRTNPTGGAAGNSTEALVATYEYYGEAQHYRIENHTNTAGVRTDYSYSVQQYEGKNIYETVIKTASQDYITPDTNPDVTRIKYNDQGQIIKKLSPDGGVTFYEYYLDGLQYPTYLHRMSQTITGNYSANFTTVIRTDIPIVNRLDYEYSLLDAYGRVEQFVNPEGGITDYYYDAYGRLYLRSDPYLYSAMEASRQKVFYDYTPYRDRLECVIHYNPVATGAYDNPTYAPVVSEVYTLYDGLDRPILQYTEVQDKPEITEWLYETDCERLAWVQGSDLAYNHVLYDTAGRPWINVYNHDTANPYDDLFTSAHAVKLFYNANSELVQEYYLYGDGDGSAPSNIKINGTGWEPETSYGRDWAGRVAMTVDVVSQRKGYSIWNADGQLAQQWSKDGNNDDTSSVSYAYHDNGDLETITDTLTGAITTVSANYKTNTSTVTDSVANVYTDVTDSVGRVTNSSYVGINVAREFTKNHGLIKSAPAGQLGDAPQAAYGPGGNLTQTVVPDLADATTKFHASGSGPPGLVQDPESHLFDNDLDEAGLAKDTIEDVQDEQRHTLSHRDPMARTSQIERNTQITTTTHDLAGRPESTQYDHGGGDPEEESVIYDKYGRIAFVTRKDETCLQFEYYPRDQTETNWRERLRYLYVGDTVDGPWDLLRAIEEYDRFGHATILKEYNSPGITTDYVLTVRSYHTTVDDPSFGRLTSETTTIYVNNTIEAGPFTVGYAYDAVGRRSAFTYPGGTNLAYDYVHGNLLSLITRTNDSYIVYSCSGRDPHFKLPTQKRFNHLQIPVNINYHSQHLGLVSSLDYNGTPFALFNYDQRGLKDETGQWNAGFTRSYDHDSLGRLVEADPQAGMGDKFGIESIPQDHFENRDHSITIDGREMEYDASTKFNRYDDFSDPEGVAALGGAATFPKHTTLNYTRINFQPDPTVQGNPEVPDGYLADTGEIYGDRGDSKTYGWQTDNQANADKTDDDCPVKKRTWNLLTPDNAWEYELANDTYFVRVVCGHPTEYTNSRYIVKAEGTTQIMDETPSADTLWYNRWAEVTVADGRLTLTTTAEALNNRLCYVEIILLSEWSEAPTENIEIDYDGRGNLEEDSHFEYCWDAFDRIATVEDKTWEVGAATPQTVTYLYDALGRRVAHLYTGQSSGWEDVMIIYDGVAPIEERYMSGDDEGEIKHRYYYEDGINKLALVECFFGQSSPVLTLVPLTDDRGTVVGVIYTSNGTVVEKLYYNSTGLCKSFNISGMPITDPATGFNVGRSLLMPFGWCGMYRDEFTGKYHTLFREYDPIHGRWLSEDPAGYKDSMSLYAAMMGVNWTDKVGLRKSDDDFIKGLYREMYPGVRETAEGIEAAKKKVKHAYNETRELTSVETLKQLPNVESEYYYQGLANAANGTQNTLKNIGNAGSWLINSTAGDWIGAPDIPYMTPRDWSFQMYDPREDPTLHSISMYLSGELTVELGTMTAGKVVGGFIDAAADARKAKMLDKAVDTGSVARKTKRAKSIGKVRATRMPRSDGYWSNPHKPGHSFWHSTIDSVNEITGGEPVPFYNGRPNFNKWAVGKPMKFRKGQLTGDYTNDMRLVHERLVSRKELGLSNLTEAENWLRRQGLSPHHKSTTIIQLVPTKLHGPIMHVGSASDLRRGIY